MLPGFFRSIRFVRHGTSSESFPRGGSAGLMLNTPHTSSIRTRDSQQLYAASDCTTGRRRAPRSVHTQLHDLHHTTLPRPHHHPPLSLVLFPPQPLHKSPLHAPNPHPPRALPQRAHPLHLPPATNDSAPPLALLPGHFPINLSPSPPRLRSPPFLPHPPATHAPPDFIPTSRLPGFTSVSRHASEVVGLDEYPAVV